MARSSRLVTYSSLILLLILISAGALYLYDKYGKATLDPLDAIPGNTGIFIRIQKPGYLIRELSTKNEIWRTLLEADATKNILDRLEEADSIMSAGGYEEMLAEGELCIAIAESDSLGTAACALFRWPYSAGESELAMLFKRGNAALKGSAMSFNGMDGIVLSDSAGPIAYYAIHRGLCMIGSSPGILDDCAERIREGSPIPFSDLYQRVASTAGRNVDANIFINFERFPHSLKKILDRSFFNDREVLPGFGAWAGIDLLVKDDELLLNGYSEAVDSLHHYLSLFRRQQAQKIEITRILPYNTSLLLSYGFSDFASFYEAHAGFQGQSGAFPDRESRLESLMERFGPNLEKYMTNWVGNELALAMINPHLREYDKNTFLAIHAADIELAVRQLKSLSSSQYTMEFRDYTIRRIDIPGLLPVVYGNTFSAIEENYYARIEDYIVFANSAGSIENFINIFLSGKTLEQNENFKGFTDNVSDLSNVFCYFNIRNSTKLLEDALDDPFADFIRRNANAVRNFEALAIQVKTLNNMFFTSVYLKHNPDYIREDLSIWKAYLDAGIYGQPYFVKDHRTNNLKIVAFDTLNNMYLIDHEGNIKWKLNIGERVISDVHTVDYYRNGKIQYLFNTEKRIYLIDLLGRDVEGYPVELKGTATNGIAVFDYDNNKDYRIMLALDDNRVYNYNIKGKRVEGWKPPLSKGVVLSEVQHLRVSGRDYIIIADSEGNVRITNRRGGDRINLKASLMNGLRSGFYVNETNSKGIILTTDADGKLTYIKANGRIETTDFGEFSAEHYFLYEDFDNRGGKDFIYLDGNRLSVFDRFKNVMFTWDFENEINSSPVIIPLSPREKIIGVVSGSSGKIYLFDPDGNLLSTPDHIGKTQILIGSLKRNGQLNMIVGSGRTIYNYYFR